MANSRLKLEASWRTRLEDEFEQGYMRSLSEFLREQKQARKVLYPPGEQIFRALDLTPFERVRVVVIGQDPYHGPGQAHGLCFSVAHGVPQPPSLVNIFKEISEDCGGGERSMPSSEGSLVPWAEQGVLLLNAVLTVERGRAGAHQGRGWERFTDRIVAELNEHRSGLVFLLWGSYAQKKGAIVNDAKHLVLRAPHPSPLSAHRGFFGCRHFSQANRYLAEQGLPPIDWFHVGESPADI